jgi:hypothetical protein
MSSYSADKGAVLGLVSPVRKAEQISKYAAAP